MVEGVRASIITQCDRVICNDASVEHIHQEDTCQALRVFPQQKKICGERQTRSKQYCPPYRHCYQRTNTTRVRETVSIQYRYFRYQCSHQKKSLLEYPNHVEPAPPTMSHHSPPPIVILRLAVRSLSCVYRCRSVGKQVREDQHSSLASVHTSKQHAYETYSASP